VPITFDIRENGWVIYKTLTDPWSVEEMIPYVVMNRQHRDHCLHTVHSFYNLLGSHRLPPNVLRLRYGSPDLYHPRSGKVVLVGANPAARSVIEIIFTLVRFERFKFFSTEEEGWAYLHNFIESSQVTKDSTA